MDKQNIIFTKEEISVIDKNLNFIVFDWAKHLVSHIINQAQNQGVSKVYINTPQTLDSGSTEGKTEYFYSKLPPQLGFHIEDVNLRGKGEEKLWAYDLNATMKNAISKFIKTITAAKTFTLQDIPPKYQGAVINIIGKKPLYDENDLKKVLDIITKKQPSGKSLAKFYYDWNSTTWSGAQRFRKDRVETVVLQKIPSELQNFMLQNPALTKFWSYIISHAQHFGNDVIGFALISKINKDEWVINEIQTDVINLYHKIRNSYYKNRQETKSKLSWGSIVDMLEAQNKSKWIPIIENDRNLINQVLNNPEIINSLPDNTIDLYAWIEKKKQNQGNQGNANNPLELHFASINFNSRIFKCY